MDDTDAHTERLKAIIAKFEEQLSAFYATFGRDSTIALLKGLLKAARKLPPTPKE